jgi:hypothetical protein
MILEAMHALHRAAGEAIAADRWAALSSMCAILDAERLGAPLPVFQDMVTDYEGWASLASPLELEAMHQAVMAHLADAPMHVKARKRLLAALFRSLSDDDKKAFREWAANGE